MKGSPPLDHLLSSITALLPEQELFSYFPLCKINITHVKWITEFYAVRNLYIVTCEPFPALYPEVLSERYFFPLLLLP